MKNLHTLRDFVRWGASRFNEAGCFFGHGADNAFDEAMFLVCHALHLPQDMPAGLYASNLTEDEQARVIELIERRIDERVPAAYLTREAWFAGLSFYVDERVLVPRSPIAELIEQGFQPWLDNTDSPQILDLCTGSGCIGIATAEYLPGASVTLGDISDEALVVAEINVHRFGMEERVSCVKSDLFAALAGQRFDLIVSNPPYVDADELAHMPQEYTREPELGLAAGRDGLDIVRRILAQAAAHLNDDGILICEVGVSRAALVAAYPQLSFTWLEFERGGEGVFLLQRDQLPA